MRSVVSALVEALKTLLNPKMLALVLWPILLALIVWLAIAFFYWGSWADSLTALIQATPLEKWVQQGFLATVSNYLVKFMLAVLLLAAVYLTAMLITAVFVMPIMVNHMARKYYPDLERKQGGTIADSVANTAAAIAVYCLGWVLSLPLWLFLPLAIVLPVILMAYLNQRLFRYDALSEHASKQEYEQIVRHAAPRLYSLGAIIGLLNFVPLVNLFTPIYAGLAFIHLCLGELKRLRHGASQHTPAP